MKFKNILLVVAVAAVIFVIFYASTGEADNESYIQQIEEDRKERDHFMKTSKESPLANSKDEFKGLKYFPVDGRYRILADLTPIENKQTVLLQTSDGKTERYMEYGYAEFELDGIQNKLLIFEMMQMGPARGKLFLAFGDETSARETYGAGRYLDINKVPGATTITLDFNNAYNPYCAYNETYSCPLPPQGNLLNVAIRAGEKIYH
jgi:uncharacterized protein (DUF1684 family)